MICPKPTGTEAQTRNHSGFSHRKATLTAMLYKARAMCPLVQSPVFKAGLEDLGKRPHGSQVKQSDFEQPGINLRQGKWS